MMSFVDSLDRLTKIFQRFPGIGPRQAGRFVQFLLRSSPTLRRELIEAVKELGGSVRECPECMRFHADNEKTCGICADSGRDRSALAVVATDSAKQAHYLPAIMNVQTWFGSVEDCVNAALTGRWSGELK